MAIRGGRGRMEQEREEKNKPAAAHRN
jgi:hypothetical protein